jgi:hypothetical protein
LVSINKPLIAFALWVHRVKGATRWFLHNWILRAISNGQESVVLWVNRPQQDGYQKQWTSRRSDFLQCITSLHESQGQIQTCIHLWEVEEGITWPLTPDRDAHTDG